MAHLPFKKGMAATKNGMATIGTGLKFPACPG